MSNKESNWTIVFYNLGIKIEKAWITGQKKPKEGETDKYQGKCLVIARHIYKNPTILKDGCKKKYFFWCQSRKSK